MVDGANAVVVEPYVRLREAIFLGDLKPGERLAENALAKQFNVSRTPIRQALTRLEQDGLVVRSGSGLTVRDQSPGEILDAYDLWVLLEAEVARVAADRRTSNDLLALEQAARRYEGTGSDDARTRVLANRLFHHTVWQAAHHEALAYHLQRLEVQLGHSPRTTLVVPGRFEQSVDEHSRLVDAIRDREVNAAGDLAHEHFQNARALRVQILQEESW